MPIVAAALSLRGGETHTCAGEKADRAPGLHPLVSSFLDGLPLEQRERFTGRCPEAVLLSQYFDTAEGERSRRAARRPFTEGDARKSLRGARLTTVRIREEGDPAHGTHQPPCRSCVPLLAHFGVQVVALAPSPAKGT
ncbi:YwqJ-related putative deaminase [Streptacidiphilus sp. N1-3]|uniref:YwqJ-related putative deaminase n=1 Tax=Streptacidiphilus alkalitolerans TaxID=3342712 RepID=A0ABV6XAI4_9ACTN